MVRLSTQNIYSMFSWVQITLKCLALRFTLHPNMCTHAPDAEAVRLIYGIWMETLMLHCGPPSYRGTYMKACAMTTVLNDLNLVGI